MRRNRRTCAAVALAAALVAGLAACAEDAETASSPATMAAPAGTATASTDSTPDGKSTPGGAASVVPEESQVPSVEPLAYTGRDSVTALDLLKEADPASEVSGNGEQAFVVMINGHKADDSKHEFWALYVNGQLANVGAGSLQTKNGDVIEWRLETY